MIALGERVFVDAGAWIGLTVKADRYRDRALQIAVSIDDRVGKRVTSVPVVLETFMHLERKYKPELALQWLDGLRAMQSLEIVGCAPADLEQARGWLDRKIPKLGIVDATSFAIMKRLKIRYVFAFDGHFGKAGFRYVE